MRILIVDDSEHFRLVACKALDLPGYEVETAIDGFQGLARIEQFKPDLVFTDVDMPKLNGIDLTEIASECGYRVIVMTGNNTLLDEAVANVSGAKDFIVKDSKLAESIVTACKANQNEQ